MSGARRRRGVLVLMMSALAGSALAQPPDIGQVRPDEVRALAGRLKSLDPGVGPFGLDRGMLQKRIDDLRKANPGKSNQELAEDIAKANKIDPKQFKPLLDWVQKHQSPSGTGGFPNGVRPPVLDRPAAAKPRVSSPVPSTTPPDRGQSDTTRPTPSAATRQSDSQNPSGRTPPLIDSAASMFPSGSPTATQAPLPPGVPADRQEQYEAVTKWWENNVGPLKDTPAVQNMLMEMITSGSPAGGPADGPLGDLFQSAAKSYSGSDVAGLMPDSLPSLSGWQPPRVNPGDWSAGMGRPGFSSSGGAPSFGGGGGSWLPVVLFVAVAGVGLVLFWLWPRLTGSAADGPAAVAGLGPWPVDPRSIADREGLVRAFEYLSVLVNGGTARTWNHRTTADGFRRNVPGAADGADELAEAYALARYTPAGQPLPPGIVAAARGHLCRIAGVPA